MSFIFFLFVCMDLTVVHFSFKHLSTKNIFQIQHSLRGKYLKVRLSSSEKLTLMPHVFHSLALFLVSGFVLDHAPCNFNVWTVFVNAF